MKQDFKKTVLEIVENDTRYQPEAYEFISAAINFTMKDLKTTKKHIKGKELLLGVRKFALQQFGPIAKDVFKEWGVVNGRSVGYIVFNMVEAGLLHASENDSIDDFDFIDDFSKELEAFTPQVSDITLKDVPIII